MILHFIAYLLIAAILFFFNLINESYLPFLLNVFFVAISIVGLIIVFVHHRYVKVSFESENSVAERTEKHLVRCVVENKGLLPLTRCKVKFVAYYKGSKKKKTYSRSAFCAGKSKEYIEFYIDCPNCEIIDLKISRIYVYDFLNLLCLRKKAGQTNMVLVMPHLPVVEIIEKMAYVINEEDGTIYSENKPGDDPTEVFAIREYVPGDNVRKIHWKLSSKSDKLMVKDFSLPIKNNDMVIIDLFQPGKGQKANNNEVFDLFYGLVNAMTRRKVGFNVGYYNENFKMKRIETQNDIYVLFSQLYAIEAYPKTEKSAAELFYAENCTKKCKMFYVTNFLDENSENRMRLLSEMGTVFYLIPGYVHNSYMPVKFVW